MKKQKRNIRFRLSAPVVETAIEKIAHNYMVSANKLTPLIIGKKMSPATAVVLIASYTDAAMAGATKTHKMSEEQMIGTCNLLMRLWQGGQFRPGPDYPYTLEQTLSDIVSKDDGSEAEA